jgi:pyruvate dehydrogenase E2 component (dihydrolipoamide acetyltransferase)
MAVIRERVPLRGPRAIIAQRMSYSASVIPHIYLSITVDAAEIVRLRQKRSASVQEHTGHKLTYTGILAYIVSRVLPRHPYLNSSLAADEIVLWEDVNIGLATDLGDYLIVPVVRQAHQKSLDGITAEIGRLLDGARTRKLGPDEMRNGTFTISNLGMFGIESFTAIINPPEAAILAVGKLVEGSAGTTMNLVLGADHRIVDGAKAARFLVELKEAIEYPYFLD